MSTAEIISYDYQQERSTVARGDRQIKSYKKKGYNKLYGGNGSYRMIKDPVANITAKVDGSEVTQSVNDLVKDYCHSKKISESKFEKFCEDCKSGKIKLKYENGHFYI